MTEGAGFDGFSDRALAFLKGLAANNGRTFASGAPVEELQRAFAAAAPLYHFLLEAIALPA